MDLTQLNKLVASHHLNVVLDPMLDQTKLIELNQRLDGNPITKVKHSTLLW